MTSPLCKCGHERNIHVESTLSESIYCKIHKCNCVQFTLSDTQQEKTKLARLTGEKEDEVKIASSPVETHSPLWTASEIIAYIYHIEDEFVRIVISDKQNLDKQFLEAEKVRDAIDDLSCCGAPNVCNCCRQLEGLKKELGL